MSKIKFYVLSRKEIENKEMYNRIRVPHILISINESEMDLAKISENKDNKYTLRLIFNDIDQQEENGILFNNNKALQVIDTVDEYLQDMRNIVVHCHAGVSRSVAVASALSKILNNEDDRIFKAGCPNMLVYNTILNTYFLEDNFHEKWSNIWKVRKTNLPENFVRFTTLYK